MDALEFYEKFYCGDGIAPEALATGFKAKSQEEMICDCDENDECCGD